MDEVTSKDGTTIAFDRSGEASPVNLVGGAQADRSAGEPRGRAPRAAFHRDSYDHRGEVGAGRSSGGAR
jgi:hypothetical protein